MLLEGQVALKIVEHMAFAYYPALEESENPCL